MKKGTIALIAHDSKKDELVEFVAQNRAWFIGFSLVGTGTTGGRIAEQGIDIECLASGPLGGDAQIAARITEGNVHAVIFFRDPMGKHPHEPDINMLLRQCDVHNIPLATNLATAQLLTANQAFKRG
ncbi:MAG: methylglyoxal synthase [Crocinitomicaceae bacterium]|nr:methylglyoxal synthase [Crocinitomicaceae bacterium]|tara:strand:+ start:15 stop:395 length:381 start_codon:yes stop_codon:yes gene_type:complete